MRIKRLLRQNSTPAVQPSTAFTAFALMLVAAGVGFSTAHARTVATTSPVALEHALHLRPAIETVPVQTTMMIGSVEVPPLPPPRRAGDAADVAIDAIVTGSKRPVKMEVASVEPLVLSADQVAQDKPAKVTPGVMAGNLVNKTQPTYPDEARAKRVQGTVVLHALIAKDGTIKALQLVSGPEELRKSAWNAVMQWMYKPYLLNGQPTEVETDINVNYHMSDGLPETSEPKSSSQLPEGFVPHALPPGCAEGHCVTPPQMVYQVKPAPPEGGHPQGPVTVALHFTININGQAENVRVVQSGGKAWDDRAIEAMLQSRWAPAEKYNPVTGKSEPMHIEVETSVVF